MVKKKITNFLTAYFAVGLIYAFVEFIKFIFKFGIISNTKFLLIKFVVTTLMYPFMLVMELWLGIVLEIIIWQYILGLSILTILIYFIGHKIFSTIKPEIKHVVFTLLFVFFWIALFTSNAYFVQEEVLKNQNYRTILIDYETNTADKNLSYYEGFELDKHELSIFLVDDEFVKQNYGGGDNVAVLGFYSSEDKAVYINTESVRYRSRMSSEYYLKLENVFMHEFTHYLDDRNLLRQKEEVYNLESRYNSALKDRVLTRDNQDYFIELGENVDDIPFNLRSSVDFHSVFYERNYKAYQYEDEVVARISAICIQLDENSNLNKVKVADYEICEDFEFPNYYLTNYDIFLEDMVGNYVDTFKIGTKPAIRIPKQ